MGGALWSSYGNIGLATQCIKFPYGPDQVQDWTTLMEYEGLDNMNSYFGQDKYVCRPTQTKLKDGFNVSHIS